MMRQTDIRVFHRMRNVSLPDELWDRIVMFAVRTCFVGSTPTYRMLHTFFSGGDCWPVAGLAATSKVLNAVVKEFVLGKARDWLSDACLVDWPVWLSVFSVEEDFDCAVVTHRTCAMYSTGKESRTFRRERLVDGWGWHTFRYDNARGCISSLGDKDTLEMFDSTLAMVLIRNTLLQKYRGEIVDDYLVEVSEKIPVTLVVELLFFARTIVCANFTSDCVFDVGAHYRTHALRSEYDYRGVSVVLDACRALVELLARERRRPRFVQTTLLF